MAGTENLLPLLLHLYHSFIFPIIETVKAVCFPVEHNQFASNYNQPSGSAGTFLIFSLVCGSVISKFSQDSTGQVVKF